MLLVNVTINKADVKRFGDLATDQLPFATARALTWTAKQAQEDVRASLPKNFILRNTYLKSTIRYTPATKSFQQSEVGSTAKFIPLHEPGGTKRPKGKHLAVPVSVKGNAKDKISKRDRPKALLSGGTYTSTRGRSNRIFKIDESTPARYRHGMDYGIYADHGSAIHKGKRKKAKGIGLTMLYRLIPVGDIDARLGLRETTQDVVDKHFFPLFSKSMASAIATKKS